MRGQDDFAGEKKREKEGKRESKPTRMKLSKLSNERQSVWLRGEEVGLPLAGVTRVAPASQRPEGHESGLSACPGLGSSGCPAAPSQGLSIGGPPEHRETDWILFPPARVTSVFPMTGRGWPGLDAVRREAPPRAEVCPGPGECLEGP